MILLTNDKLNPKLYSNNKLKDDVRQAILNIVSEFKEYLEIPINILDVRIVGSNASYNYTKKSDIDIHLIVNFDELSNNNDLVQVLFNSKRKSFNSTFDITIKGLDAEIYVEDINTSAISNGIYSVLQNCWIKFPTKQNNNIKLPNIDDLLNKYASKIDTIFKQGDNVTLEEVTDIINNIYMLRKNSLSKSGEYGKGNLVFKQLRNLGYIEKLINLQNKLISKELSLEHLK